MSRRCPCFTGTWVTAEGDSLDTQHLTNDEEWCKIRLKAAGRFG